MVWVISCWEALNSPYTTLKMAATREGQDMWYTAHSTECSPSHRTGHDSTRTLLSFLAEDLDRSTNAIFSRSAKMTVTDACIMLPVVSPSEELPPNVCRISNYCRYSNDVLVRNYNIAAHVASTCNTFSVSECAITYLKLIHQSGNTNTTQISQWDTSCS